MSNAAGFYEVREPGRGSIATSTGNTTAGLLGEASGQLATDGETLTLDILLQSNAITLPMTLNDVNSAPFDIQPGGETLYGLGATFSGSDAWALRFSR